MQDSAPAPATTSAPAALLRALTAQFPVLGITRLADQTGLDRSLVPCFAAIRPNSATVTTHQGKGLDPLTAKLSAVMEAAEYHYAEAPDAPVLALSRSAAERLGHATMNVAHLLPPGLTPAADVPVAWLEGYRLRDGQPILVPRDCLVLGTPPRHHPGISQSTNGLAAGATRAAAILHGLCEVVERDAVCLSGFRPDAAMAARCIDPARFADTALDALLSRLDASGFAVSLFDVTTDIALPVFYAVLSPRGGPDRHVDAGTGAACHPVPAVAAQRAILEAAQTRISLIAGARDDIAAGDYRAPPLRDIAALTAMQPRDRRPPSGLPRASDVAEYLSFTQSQIGEKGHEPVVVPLGGAGLGIEVLRVFVPGLEDRLTNRNWRPGPRAARAMLGVL